MRLDKYLKVARLIKRRTVANEACDNGLVTVNDKPARASYDVKVGDALFIAAKVAQMSGVDPEDALHRACDKFDQRFRYVEAQADKPLSAYSEAELVKLWQEAKAHQHA